MNSNCKQIENKGHLYENNKMLIALSALEKLKYTFEKALGFAVKPKTCAPMSALRGTEVSPCNVSYRIRVSFHETGLLIDEFVIQCCDR